VGIRLYPERTLILGLRGSEIGRGHGCCVKSHFFQLSRYKWISGDLGLLLVNCGAGLLCEMKFRGGLGFVHAVFQQNFSFKSSLELYGDGPSGKVLGLFLDPQTNPLVSALPWRSGDPPSLQVGKKKKKKKKKKNPQKRGGKN